MDELKNCKICGRLFQANSLSEYCQVCVERDEEDFDRIRDYLDIHPFAKIFEVSITLNISINKIKRFLREGRMEIVEKNNQFLKCDCCGKSICSGQLCEECKTVKVHDIRTYYVGAQVNYKAGIKYKTNTNLTKARP